MKYIPLLFLLIACSSSKNITKSDTSVDTKTNTEIAETEQAKTETESKDKTTTTIEADTVINVPVINETGETVTKKVSVKFKKTIIKEEEKKITETVKKDSTATVKQKKKEDNQQKEKQVKHSGIPWWIWIIAAIVLILFVAWRINKRL